MTQGIYMIKLVLAACAALIGLTVTGYALYQGHFTSAVALVLATACCVLRALAGPIRTMLSSSFELAAGVIGTIGLFGTFFSHAAFDLKLQAAYAEATDSFLRMDPTCLRKNPQLSSVLEAGARACALQGNSDQISGVHELSKGLHLGPTLSIADSTNSMLKAERQNTCANIFMYAVSACPGSFSDISASGRQTLLAAAKLRQ